MQLVSTEDIAAAATRLDGRIARTPLLPCARLTEELGVPVLLKAENLQHTGSFKVRGALNALLAQRERGTAPAGVATFSAGNFGAAAAFAGRTLGIPAVVCMPKAAVATKIEAVRRYGGEPILTDDLLATCRAVADERGFAVLHPFDDLDVIAGQGTVGAEIAAGDVDPDLVLVPVGGGGLISGVAPAVKASYPRARVIGIEPDSANAMTYALRAGTPAPLPARPVSVADGLAAPFAGEYTLAHVQQFVEEIIEVPEAAILPAWRELIETSKLFVEPSAAVGLVALRLGLVTPRPGEVVVLVLSGGNTTLPAS